MQFQGRYAISVVTFFHSSLNKNLCAQYFYFHVWLVCLPDRTWKNSRLNNMISNVIVISITHFYVTVWESAFIILSLVEHSKHFQIERTVDNDKIIWHLSQGLALKGWRKVWPITEMRCLWDAAMIQNISRRSNK